MIRILFLLCLIFLIEVDAKRRRCVNSGVTFHEKISRSPIVVYATSTSKSVHLHTDTEFLFNVTLHVQCVLKGQDIQERIEITEAGVKAGRTACQSLEPEQTFLVFLEQWGTTNNSYRPVDFEEIHIDDTTDDLLKKTCHLKGISPLSSTKNNCPNVSLPEYCPHDNIDMNAQSKDSSKNIDANGKSTYFDDGIKFILQSNVIMPKSGSATIQVQKDKASAASSLKISSISLMILMAMIF